MVRSPNTETRIECAPAYREMLAREGFLDLDSVMGRQDGEAVKALLKERQTFRFRLSDGTAVYLKRYPQDAAAHEKRSWFARPFDSPASREWHALKALADLGVPAIEPLALGEEFTGGKVSRAYLVTLGLDAPRTLEQVVLADFGDSGDAAAMARKRRMTRALANILRAMHEGGVNHRDFYLCHIRAADDDRLFVTDLNRADLRKRVGLRWRVKDVAALYFSAPRAIISRADCARFLRTYLDGKLRKHGRFLRAAARKAARMEAHTRRKMARGEANYHLSSERQS